jgi:hypothetical protein
MGRVYVRASGLFVAGFLVSALLAFGDPELFQGTQDYVGKQGYDRAASNHHH